MPQKPRQAFRHRLIQVSKSLIPSQPVFIDHRFVGQFSRFAKLTILNRRETSCFNPSAPTLVVMLEGKKTFGSSENPISVQSGEVFFASCEFSCEVSHQLSSLGHCSALQLELSPSLLEQSRRAYPELIQSTFSSSHPPSQERIKLKVKLFPALEEALIHFMIGLISDEDQSHNERPSKGENQSHWLHEHHLIEIILLLLQSNIRPFIVQVLYPDFVTQVQLLIRSDLASDWSLKRLAQTLGLSVSTIKRRLQEQSLSYRQILDQERMTQAMELVVHSTLTLMEIASACGYQSQSRFSTRFRYYHGQSPSEARAQHGSQP